MSWIWNVSQLYKGHINLDALHPDNQEYFRLIATVAWWFTPSDFSSLFSNDYNIPDYVINSITAAA